MPLAGEVISMLKETFKEWQEDKASRLAAALTYYTLFSLAPFLLILISVLGLLVDPEDMKGEISVQVESLVGPDGAAMIQTMIENADQSGATGWAGLVGLVTLALGATGVFNALRDALNTIWNVTPAPGRGLLGMIKDRLTSFSLIPVTGFLLLVSLVADAGLSLMRNYFAGIVPGEAWSWVIQGLGLIVSLLVITFLFAAIYKILPDADIAWRDVWVGALVTSFLFTLGRFLIGLYIGHSSAASVYGAAGALIVILLWVYYSAQVLFLGAEFTQVYARRYGSRIQPEKGAVALAGDNQDQRPESRPVVAYASEDDVSPLRPTTAVAPAASGTIPGYAVTAVIAFFLGALIQGQGD